MDARQTEGRINLPPYFTIRRSARLILSMLSDEERGRMLMALMDYADYGTRPDYCEGISAGVFEMLASDIDRCFLAWQRQQAGRSRGGNATKKKWDAARDG